MRSAAANLAVHTRDAASVTVAQPAPTTVTQPATQVSELPPVATGRRCQLPAEATATATEGGHTAQDASAAGRGRPGRGHQKPAAIVLSAAAAAGGTFLRLFITAFSDDPDAVVCFAVVHIDFADTVRYVLWYPDKLVGLENAIRRCCKSR